MGNPPEGGAGTNARLSRLLAPFPLSRKAPFQPKIREEVHEIRHRRRHRSPALVPAPRPRLHRFLAALVIAGLVLVLVLAFGFRFGTDEMWWFEIARYVPFPAYLVPALLLVACAWPLGWRWRALALVTPVLVATELMGLAVGSPDAGGARLRFMTYNIKAYLARKTPDGYARIAWEIARHDPDVIVMQDAGSIESAEQLPAPMKAALKGRQVYVQGQYIVASRYPLSHCAPGNMSFSGQEDDFVHCTLGVAGKDIDLFTAHFVSPRDGLNAARGRAVGGMQEWETNFNDRMAQSIQLSAAVAKATHPVIVAGDLNADEHSPVVRRLLANGLRDAFSSAAVGYGYTIGHDLRPGFSFLRIDHVLVSPDIGVRDAAPGGREGSEHRPVVADLLVGS
jgi:endonuclease/exonuclease/phosphatase (EEP) superfamily protein YafD